MSDMQSFGHGFQASQLNDLCSLHGRDFQVTSRMVLPMIGEQSDQPRLPIPLTGSPDSGFVTLQLRGEVFSPLPGGDLQHDSGTPDLIPGRRITVSDPFQLCDVGRKDRQHFGLRPRMCTPPVLKRADHITITGGSNSVQVFVPIDTRTRRTGHPGRAPAHSSTGGSGG